ncbi:uncharacterized protein TrAFT101_009149 [Trichoderma asperellum]|uniref:uncharacterized protein n=1 Tax=Trichoderma asperellum TaxID=101201 RepID=UPI00332C6EC6|nr:hypothetical protein TrAFT101_009149 [Trichoderma asperellum]
MAEAIQGCSSADTNQPGGIRTTDEEIAYNIGFLAVDFSFLSISHKHRRTRNANGNLHGNVRYVCSLLKVWRSLCASPETPGTAGVACLSQTQAVIISDSMVYMLPAGGPAAA